MDEGQVQQFCSKWTMHRKRDGVYKGELLSAVSGLREEYVAEEGGTLVENPLMLTAVCMVFDRYKALPDDRGRLCELLIEDLCRSRRSEDPFAGWKLDDSQKKDILQRIALSMQVEGAQDWELSKAEELVFEGVPVNDPHRHDKARRYLVWTAEHTGLLRFNAEDTGEKIRFWHRVFREYLAASRLAQMDITVAEQIQQLWRDGVLLNPFWEDVVRMLPRAYVTREKAASLIRELEKLASENPDYRGRLLGLATAAIVESRDLFPEIEENEKAKALSGIFTEESKSWPIRDRCFFLRGLGRLSRKLRDPRLENCLWVLIPDATFYIPKGGKHAMAPPSNYKSKREWKEKNKVVVNIHNSAFEIRKYPVTIQEYSEFLESPEIVDRRIWSDTPEESIHHIVGAKPDSWQMQLRQPNEPVTGISMYEALAFCRWLCQKGDGKYLYDLPTFEQLLGAMYEVDAKKNVELRNRASSWEGLLDTLPDIFKIPVGSVIPEDIGFKSPLDQFSVRYEWTKGDGAGLVTRLPLASAGFTRFQSESPKLARIIAVADYDNLGNKFGFSIEAHCNHPVIGFRCIRRQRGGTQET